MSFPVRKGVTLIETLLYIGALSILLPVLVVSLIRITQEIHVFDLRNRVSTSTSLVFSQLSLDITRAATIQTSSSTLGVNPSVLVFTDTTGETVTIDRPTVTVSLPSGDQTIHRLRMQRGEATPFFFTDPDLDVVAWRVDEVRSQSGPQYTLMGLRFHLELATPQQSGPFQTARFVGDTTIALQPHTTQN